MNLTQELKSSIALVSHRKGLERAEALLSLYEKACKIVDIRQHQSDQFYDYGHYETSAKWQDKAGSARRASERIALAYHNQIAEILQTPLRCNR